jgi:ribosomal protein L11 methyltransferase
VVSVAAFERQTLDGSDGAVWQVELLHQGEPEGDELQSWLEPLAEAAGLAPIEVSVAPLPATDWLASTASSFPPQRIGRFWIHGSHIEQPPPAGAVPIRIDAGLAFGSGEHATTQGCLLALDQLARRRRFRRVLDLGSGSGILAIAAAKCWPARVVAADHDPSAPPVAAANSADNGVGHHIEHLQSEGFANRAIRRHGPYDLIMANILAEPLIELARPLVRHLAPDGTVILSGLLDRQAARVGAAYRAMGLSVRDQHPIGIWTTLVMARTRRR